MLIFYVFLSLIYLFSSSCLAQTTEIDNRSKQIQSIKMDLERSLCKLDTLYLNSYSKQCERIGFPNSDRSSESLEKLSFHSGIDHKTNLPIWVMRFIPKEIPSHLKERIDRSETITDDSSITKNDEFTCRDLLEKEIMKGSLIAMAEQKSLNAIIPLRTSFLYQKVGKLNAFIQLALATSEEGLFVTYGAIIEEGMEKKTVNNTSCTIPFSFYILLLDMSSGQEKAIAFVLPNAGSGNKLAEFSVSIQELEEMTNVRFLTGLPSTTQQKLKSAYQIQDWINLDKKANGANTSKTAELNSVKWPTGSITTNELMDHLDTYCTVCGTVASTHKTSSNRVYLNIDKPYPNQPFSATIMSEDVETFSEDPSVYLKGKKVCLKGKLTLYRDKPSMIINGQDAVSVIQP